MNDLIIICFSVSLGILIFIVYLLNIKNKKLIHDLKIRINEESLYLSLFDKGDSTLFKWRNDEHWSIENVSQSAKELLGFTQEDFMSSEVVYTSCIHKEDLATVTQEVMDACKSNVEYFKHEPYRIITKDKTVKWVLDYTTVVRDEDGEISHFIGVITDITGIKRKDEKLLEQSRLAQMGEMISMIAHQWRQPLGAISSTAIDLKMKIELEEFTLDSIKEQERCFDYFSEELNNIEEFTKNLTETIDDFRDFYRQNRTLKYMNLNEIILKSINIIKSSLYANNIILDENYKSIKKLELYDNEIMQVILNIFKNSLDNFRLNSIENGKIWIETIDSDFGVTISIGDNGGGIDELVMEKIFNPYFSTKDEKNGTGLGLYMSKMIVVDHHNGSIRAVNKNDGVCFYIDLAENL